MFGLHVFFCCFQSVKLVACPTFSAVYVTFNIFTKGKKKDIIGNK